MKPTDEDVEVARIAAIGKAWTAPDDAPAQATIISAALEAYTPRLIERLAREAIRERNYCDDLIARLEQLGAKEDAQRHWVRWDMTADWLRSFLEKNDD